MKALKYLAVIAALPLFMAACDDENSLPDVDYTVTFSGCDYNEQTNVVTVAQGDTLTVQSVSITNNEAGKNASIINVDYFWDYNLIGQTMLPPYTQKIYIPKTTPLGAHDLTLKMGIVAVDKEPAVGYLSYQVNVVAPAETPTQP